MGENRHISLPLRAIKDDVRDDELAQAAVLLGLKCIRFGLGHLNGGWGHSSARGGRRRGDGIVDGGVRKGRGRTLRGGCPFFLQPLRKRAE